MWLSVGPGEAVRGEQENRSGLISQRAASRGRLSIIRMSRSGISVQTIFKPVSELMRLFSLIRCKINDLTPNIQFSFDSYLGSAC